MAANLGSSTTMSGSGQRTGAAVSQRFISVLPAFALLCGKAARSANPAGGVGVVDNGRVLA
jgi:hypothetical protein